MDLDSKLIFEAYKQQNQKVLNEAPIDMAGDITTEPITKKTLPGQGKAYGAGAISKIAAATNKSEEEIGTEMAKEILAHTKERKMVDGKEAYHFPGDPKTFINELIPIFNKKFGIPSSQAGYTINYILIYLLNAKKTAGGLKMDASRVKAAKAERAAAAPAVKTETVYEIDKSVKIDDKALKSIVMSLPDEDVPEREILGVLKTSITEYNDKPGIEPIKIKSFDLLDKLKAVGVIKEKQVEKQAAEGEGTGEVETIEDFPETDDVGSVARELGFVGRGRGIDPGGFSYGD